MDTVGRVEFEMHLSGIRHIPIVDDNLQLIGMVSNRDILRALGRSGARKVAVRDIMTRNVYTVHDDDPARNAAEVMLAYKVGAVPVLGDEEQLVGIITETDFVRMAYGALGGM